MKILKLSLWDMAIVDSQRVTNNFVKWMESHICLLDHFLYWKRQDVAAKCCWVLHYHNIRQSTRWSYLIYPIVINESCFYQRLSFIQTDEHFLCQPNKTVTFHFSFQLSSCCLCEWILNANLPTNKWIKPIQLN